MFDFNNLIIMNIEEKIEKDMVASDVIDVIYSELYSNEYIKVHVDKLERSEREVFSNVESLVVVDIIQRYEQQEDFSYYPYYEVVMYIVEQEIYEYRWEFK